MAAVLQAQEEAPPGRILQPADNPQVDVVPLRFGVKYAVGEPCLALEYRDKQTGSVDLEEIPLQLADDSKALEVYASLRESHARLLAPWVVSVAQVVRLIQLAIDNRVTEALLPPFGAVPTRAPPPLHSPRAPPTPEAASPSILASPASPASPAVLASPASPSVLASPASPAVLATKAPPSPPVLASPAKAPESPPMPPSPPTLASPANAPESPPVLAVAPKFAVGDRVEARFEGKEAYYAGKIEGVTNGAYANSYAVAYDDGDREASVGEALIRAYVAKAVVPTDDYFEDDVEEESIAESVGSTASFDASEPSRADAASDSDEDYAFD